MSEEDLIELEKLGITKEQLDKWHETLESLKEQRIALNEKLPTQISEWAYLGNKEDYIPIEFIVKHLSDKVESLEKEIETLKGDGNEH